MIASGQRRRSQERPGGAIRMGGHSVIPPACCTEARRRSPTRQAVLVLRQPATVGRRTYALSGSLSKFASAAGSVGLLACEVVAVATGIVGEWIGVALNLRIRVFRCGVNVPATGHRVLRHRHVLSVCNPGPRKPEPGASLTPGDQHRVQPYLI